MHYRRGFTLLEQLVTLTLLGVALGITLRGTHRFRDGLAVRAASHAVRDALALARAHAASAGRRTAVRFSRTNGRLSVHAGADSLLRLSLRDQLGVSLDATRDSLAYLPSGLGYGAANVRLVLSRGAARDTITVSRLGRVR